MTGWVITPECFSGMWLYIHVLNPIVFSLVNAKVLKWSRTNDNWRYENNSYWIRGGWHYICSDGDGTSGPICKIVLFYFVQLHWMPTQKRKGSQDDSLDIHWRRWRQASTSPVNTKAVNLTTFPFLWKKPMNIRCLHTYGAPFVMEY